MPSTAMDVASVVQNLQERDKWRRRLEVLEQSLREIQARRLRLRTRLKKIQTDLKRLSDYSEAVLETTHALTRARSYASTDGHLVTR